jgi:hypothetical protein
MERAIDGKNAKSVDPNLCRVFTSGVRSIGHMHWVLAVCLGRAPLKEARHCFRAYEREFLSLAPASTDRG